MMKLTRTGIGLLTAQYRSVLRKCALINAGVFFALAPNVAEAVDCSTLSPSSSAADIAACVGTLTGSDASGYNNGWLSSFQEVPSRNNVYFYSNYRYMTISKNNTINQNLEALDNVIGSYMVAHSIRYNWDIVDRMDKKLSNAPVATIDPKESIIANLTMLDYVIGIMENGNHISRLQTVGENLKTLDTYLGTAESNITSLTTRMTAAETNISNKLNISTFNNNEVIAAGKTTAVTENSGKLVTSGAVYAAIDALDNNYYRKLKISSPHNALITCIYL